MVEREPPSEEGLLILKDLSGCMPPTVPLIVAMPDVTGVSISGLPYK